MNHKILGLLLLEVVFSSSVIAQELYWEKSVINSTKSSYNNLEDDTYFRNTLNFERFKNNLSAATLRGKASKQKDVVVLFPNEKGEFERFTVQELEIFSVELAAKFPNIKAYLGRGIDTPGARVRFSVSSHGLQSMITYPNKKRASRNRRTQDTCVSFATRT